VVNRDPEYPRPSIYSNFLPPLPWRGIYDGGGTRWLTRSGVEGRAPAVWRGMGSFLPPIRRMEGGVCRRRASRLNGSSRSSTTSTSSSRPAPPAGPSRVGAYQHPGRWLVVWSTSSKIDLDSVSPDSLYGRHTTASIRRSERRNEPIRAITAELARLDHAPGEPARPPRRRIPRR